MTKDNNLKYFNHNCYNKQLINNNQNLKFKKNS